MERIVLHALDEIVHAPAYRLTPHVILKYLDSLDGDLSDPQARDRLLDEYVSRVLVDDEKVTVVLRYTDEAKELRPLSGPSIDK